MGWLSKLFETKQKVMPVHVDDRNFDAEVLRSDVPVLVDFWSENCGPCRMLAPIVIDLATEFVGRIKVVEIDVAQAPKVCRRFQVQATPTVIYFRRGAIAERVAGFRGSLWHRDVIEKDLLGDTRAA